MATYCTVSVSSLAARLRSSVVLSEAAHVPCVAFCCCTDVHSRCRVTSAGCKLNCSLIIDEIQAAAAAAHLVLGSNKNHNQRVNIQKISCVFNR